MIELIMQNNNFIKKSHWFYDKENDKVKLDKKVKKFAIAKARYALIQKIINKESVKIECI